MILLYVALAYLLTVNLTAFLLCGADKRRAEKGRRRVSESLLLLAGAAGGCFGLGLGMRLFRHKTKHLRFRILVPLECLLWAAVAVHLASALTLDRRIQYREVSYPSPRASEGLDGYRIAFVSDPHAIPEEELRGAARRINEYAPDLLLLGGDFPPPGEGLERDLAILAEVEAADGIYGVEGNHDDSRALFAAMEEYGMTTLSNSGARVRDGLYLAGVEDLWNRSPDVGLATAGAGEDDLVLLLSHNPDVSMRQDTDNVDLILSGHTHGGYVTLFGAVAPALEWGGFVTEYGRRFQSGWAKSRDGADVFVSNGIGSFGALPRVFARPQVILIELERDEA